MQEKETQIRNKELEPNGNGNTGDMQALVWVVRAKIQRHTVHTTLIWKCGKQYAKFRDTYLARWQNEPEAAEYTLQVSVAKMKKREKKNEQQQQQQQQPTQIAQQDEK